MLPDLSRLIRIQELDTAADAARRALADIPVTLQALDAGIAERGNALEGVRARLSASQEIRRGLEKDLAAVQTRLSRYKDQLMAVKTNKEYAAMQKEIAAAEHEVKRHEDQILEHLLEGDEVSAEVTRAEQALAAARVDAVAQRQALDARAQTLETELARLGEARSALAAEISPPVLALYEGLARVRKGVVVAEARGGTCVVCHVRLRPQIFNEIRRNDTLIRCESCTRILYFVEPAAPAPTA